MVSSIVLSIFGLLALSQCMLHQLYNMTRIMSGYSQNIQAEITLNHPNITYLLIHFEAHQQYSNIVIMVDWEPIPNGLTPRNITDIYVSQNTTLMKKMDMEGVLSHGIQKMYIEPPENYENRSFYIKIFNLDLPEKIFSKTFSLDILYEDQNKIHCLACPIGTHKLENFYSCQCQPCQPNTYGRTCQNQVEPMKEDEVYSFTLSHFQNIHYRIPYPPEKTRIYFVQDSKIANKVMLYVQYQVKEGDLASKLNNYYKNDGKPMQQYFTSQEKYIDLIPEGRNITLTVQSEMKIKSTDFKIWYENPQKSPLGLILGLIFGILALLLIVICIIICLIRRNKKIKNSSKKISLLEINQNFPAIWGREVQLDNTKPGVFKFEEESKDNLAHSESQSQKTRAKSTFSCEKCKHQLADKEQIGVVYVRHLFHRSCLPNASQKELICPVCHHKMAHKQSHELQEHHSDNQQKALSPELGPGKTKQVRYHREDSVGIDE